jgi:branched-chain amino acid transport system ATP-binding protein
MTEAIVEVPDNEPLLTVEGLSVAFGGVHAVDGASFTVYRGEALGLVGPNGSGKTTLLNALTGVVSASGSVEVGSKKLVLGKPASVVSCGVARVYQTPQLVPDLDCLQNVALGARDRNAQGLTSAWLRRRSMWRGEDRRFDSAFEQLARVGMEHRARVQADSLTYGEQRLVELARALVASPEILLLDEPSAGLNDAETSALGDLLTTVRKEGVTMIIVDHKIDFVDALCARVMVLEMGRRIALGQSDTVWRDPRVVDAYLGVRNDA